MSRRVRIDRCVCKALSFAELRETAATLGDDPELLALATGAGIDCGTCHPWLERALAEGVDGFDIEVETHPQGDALLRHFGPPTEA